MRTIKFRAWDKIKRDWYDHAGQGEIEISSGYLLTFNLDGILDVIVEQYTGLKDKNGVEIYEGDFIGFGQFVFEVKYFEGAFVAVDRKFKNKTTQLSILIKGRILAKDEVAVIGNIHEVSAEINWKEL